MEHAHAQHQHQHQHQHLQPEHEHDPSSIVAAVPPAPSPSPSPSPSPALAPAPARAAPRAALPATPATGPLFQCGTCKKRYKRIDHLARHVRSHTQSKPYPCRICSKSFGRADLLKRHVAAHDVQERSDGTGSAGARRVDAGPGRVSTACKTCASCHLRCSEEKPCQRCVERGLECVWTVPPGFDDIDDVDRQQHESQQQQQQQSQQSQQKYQSQQEQPSEHRQEREPQHRSPNIVCRSPRAQDAHTNTNTNGHNTNHSHMDMDATTSSRENLSPPPPGIMPPQHQHHMPDPPGLMHAAGNPLESLSWQQQLPTAPQPQSQQFHDVPPILRQTSDVHHGGGQSHHEHQPDPGMGAMGFMNPPYFSNAFFDITSASGSWTPMGGGHMNMVTSMDLDDIDLHFLNSYNTDLPFEIASDNGTNHTPQAPPDNPPSTSASVELHTGISSRSTHASRISTGNAFKNVYWKFQPKAHDSTSAEEHNLSLPADKDGQFSSTVASKNAISRRLILSSLCLNARDKILALVVDNCQPENLKRAVASFPSIELLDALINFFLSSSGVRADSFLHIPSFNPNDKKAELLASMAAAGAVLTSDPALIKLGSAIHECVRQAVPKQWERDNSLTRDLELSQAWMISLEVAIWSGHSRKVEIAESFMQPLLTMLRRNAKFRPSGYTEVKLWRDDEGDTLEQKWKEWVMQESFKRLAFRIFQHDTDSSLALMINPLVSYAEVVVELPCSSELWSASSKERWKTAFLAAPQHQQQQTSPQNNTLPSSSPINNSLSCLTIVDCIDNPTWHMPTDVITASSAYLSIVWRLAWEYLQLASLQKKSKPQRWNSYLLAARHEELVKLLSRFRLSLDDMPPSVSNSHCMMVLMRAEHIALHIHAPFEDILRFAGMEGPEASRNAYEAVVLDWMRSEAARKAVWHAGQILRHARTVARMKIHGPLAVIVFHASLVLWLYGMMYPESVAHEGAGGGGERPSISQASGGSGTGNNGDLSICGGAPTSHPLPQQCQSQQQHPQSLGQIIEDLRLRPLVLVDDDESGAVQRFIQFDRGVPAIQKRTADSAGSGTAAGSPIQRIYLFEKDSVMEAIIEILSQNHPPKCKPPLVENLIQVLTELAKSAPTSAARSEQSPG